MLNRVVLVGRLTRDPELRVSQNNLSVVNFTIAVNRPFTDSNGERAADFINCVAFRKQAENINQYLNKGSLAGIDGRIQTRNYENKEGQRIYVTEVVCESVQFLEPKSNSNQAQQSSNNNSYTNAYSNQSRRQAKAQSNSQPVDNPFSQQNGPMDISDDDLPF